MPEADDVDSDAFDKYITAQVMLPADDQMKLGTLRKRKLDENDIPIGKSNKHPVLDTALYEVEFADSPSQFFNVNTITESIFSQIDEEGYYTASFCRRNKEIKYLGQVAAFCQI